MSSRGIVASFVFALGLATTLPAAEPQLAKTETAPPDTVSAEIRGILGPGALRVTAEGKTLAEFWLRSEVPVKETPSEELGVTFGQLAQGTLLGVVRLEASWSDYKDSPIPAGVYTLRYAVEPADGNHMGVSLYRDFLLLIPASDDATVEVSWSPDELVGQSLASTGTPHPAVLALFPIWEEPSEPGLVRNEMEQWTLAVPVGSISPTLGLVVEGHGET
jgi:hypothetical protein